MTRDTRSALIIHWQRSRAVIGHVGGVSRAEFAAYNGTATVEVFWG
jgi:hypothetical protein